MDNRDKWHELLVRSRYLLYKSPENYYPTKKEHAGTLIWEYPSVKLAYSLSNSLHQIFNSHSTKDSAKQMLVQRRGMV